MRAGRRQAREIRRLTAIKTQTCPEMFRLRGVVWIQVKIELSTGIVAASTYFHIFVPENRLTFCEIISSYVLPRARLTLSEKSSAYILRYSRLIFCVALGLNFTRKIPTVFS